MTSEILEISTDNNIYAWYDDFALEKMGGSNLNAYHQNPYINTASKKNDTQSSPEQYNDLSYLECNELKIYSEKDGWEIYNFDKLKFKDLIAKYNLAEEGDFFLLKDTEKKDRIEILTEFLTEIKENKA